MKNVRGYWHRHIRTHTHSSATFALWSVSSYIIIIMELAVPNIFIQALVVILLAFSGHYTITTTYIVVHVRSIVACAMNSDSQWHVCSLVLRCYASTSSTWPRPLILGSIGTFITPRNGRKFCGKTLWLLAQRFPGDLPTKPMNNTWPLRSSPWC